MVFVMANSYLSLLHAKS